MFALSGLRDQTLVTVVVPSPPRHLPSCLSCVGYHSAFPVLVDYRRSVRTHPLYALSATEEDSTRISYRSTATRKTAHHIPSCIYIRNTNFEPDFIDKGGKANAERRVDGQISTRYYESRHFRCVRYDYHTPLRHMPLGHVLEKIGSQIHPRGCVVLTVNVTLRGRAGHTMSLHDFPPIFFVKFAFLQQLYCFQYNRAVGTMPLGLTPAYF